MYECVQCVYTHAINICMYVHIYVYVYTHTYSYTFRCIYIYTYIHRCMLYKHCVYCWNQSWPAIHASHRFKIKSDKKKKVVFTFLLDDFWAELFCSDEARLLAQTHSLFSATSSQPFCNAKLIQRTPWRMCCLQHCLVLVKTTGGEHETGKFPCYYQRASHVLTVGKRNDLHCSTVCSDSISFRLASLLSWGLLQMKHTADHRFQLWNVNGELKKIK